MLLIPQGSTTVESAILEFFDILFILYTFVLLYLISTLF